MQAHTDIVSSGPVIKSSDAGPAKPTAPLSYASIASSRSASTPPLMSSTPPIRLQDVMDADDALLVHRTVIEDDLTWAAVASACISTLRDELACFVEETPATPRPMISAFECGCAERPVAGSTMDPCRCGAAYVWYQSECGEPAYLDPLTMRILLASVNGKHDALPRVVDATVAQIQVGTLTEALRSKHVFLRLLPVSPFFAYESIISSFNIYVVCMLQRLVRFFLVEMDTWKTAYHPPPGSSLRYVARLVRARVVCVCVHVL